MKDKDNFEKNIKAVEKIVQDLESGSIGLNDATDKFVEATKLIKKCHELLEATEKSVNKILKENGDLEDFEIK